MKQICLPLLIFLTILTTNLSYGQRNEQAKIDSLLVLIHQAKEDTNKVTLLTNLMSYHIYYKQEEGLTYRLPALQLAEKLNWSPGIYQVKQVSGKLYWRLSRFDEALKNHAEALAIAEKLQDKRKIALTLSSIGQDYGDNANYPIALNYFNQALLVAKEAGDSRRIASLYNLMSWTYEQQGNYPQAIKINVDALKIAQEMGDEDLETVTMSNIGGYYLEMGNDSMAIQYLNYSISKREKKESLTITDKISLSQSNLAIGSIYQKKQEFTKALTYYELALQTAIDINDFQTITDAFSHIGALHADQGKENETLATYLLALGSAKSLKDPKVTAELYYAIGGCYIRLRQFDEAKKYFEDARLLSLNTDSESLNYLYYAGVELLDSATGNWKDAYLHYKTAVRLNNQLYNEENSNKIMQTTMQYEYDKKEAAATAEQEKKDLMQRNIRNSITIALAGSLLFLIVVFIQRNKIAKARKRSDELLRNILPEDVAEELKEKGRAEAKSFDLVTVMFTDFKGFTQISEKLSPSELVAEIDVCFKAFDQIIDKYNIEKIKTIGDSYMCAGGLPLTNASNPVDVVNAALEIQQFIKNHIEQRKKENKEPFEIRIGINTGPVVAGIVGVKKFAYDIWGDTVNIASRMESSGEPGKINISGSTYFLVKDAFRCVYRGKVSAKNKGEIDMYFVEGLN